MDFPPETGTPLSRHDFRRRVVYAQGAVLLFGLIRVLFLSLTGLAVSGLLQVSLGFLLLPSIEWVRASWLLLAGIGVFIFMRELRHLRARTRSASVAAMLGTHPTDLISTAWELASENVSDEFRRRAVEQADQAFPKRWMARLLPSRRPVLMGLISLGLFLPVVMKVPGTILAQTLWPFRASPSHFRSIHPGNAFFPRGEDVTVSVRIFPEDFTVPWMEVRGEGSSWEKRSLNFVNSGEYAGVLRSLQDPLEYRVFCKNGRSPQFRLVPFDPPKLIRLHSEITPPPYAGQKTERLQDIFSPRVLESSRVRWTLAMAPPDSLFRLDPEPSSPAVKNGNDWSWEETAKKDQTQRLWARLRNGSSEILLAHLTIDTVSDDPPQISLLSPQEDLETGKEGPLPVTVELTEDVGLSAMGISFRVNRGEWKKENWKRFAPGIRHEIIEMNFDLSGKALTDGDHVDFYVWGQDRRSPPNEGRSETRSLDIIDTVAIHEQIVKEVESFQKSLRERLAEEREVREKVAVSTPNWGGLLTEQRQVARRLMNEETSLNTLLERMAQDPKTDRDTLWDHRGLAESLHDLNRTTLPEADLALSAKDLPRAAPALDRAVSELERMSRLSAQSAYEQTLRQLARDQSRLANRAETLSRSMGKNPSMTEEETRQFEETVQALRETMDRIGDRVNQIRKNLPENIREDERTERLRFDRVSESLSRLTQALRHNNRADAISAAQEVLEHLREIERQLNSATASLASFGAESEAALMEEQEKVHRLVQRQEAFLERTSAVAEGMRSRYLARQSKALQELRSAIPRWKSQAEAGASPMFRQAEVHAQTMRRALDRAPGNTVLDPLKEFFDHAETAQTALTDGPEKNVWASLAEESKTLLDDLTGEWGDRDLTDSDRRTLAPLSTEQLELAGETRALSQSLTEKVRQSAFLSPKIPQHLSDAAPWMEEAARSLGSRDIPKAQGHQEKALELLRDAQNKLSDTLSQRQTLSDSAGFGGSRPIRRKGGGRMGGITGDVKFPRADEFRPPTEFRQEILDSMNESYPKEEEGPVQNYFRHWTK